MVIHFSPSPVVSPHLGPLVGFIVNMESLVEVTPVTSVETTVNLSVPGKYSFISIVAFWDFCLATATLPLFFNSVSQVSVPFAWDSHL